MNYRALFSAVQKHAESNDAQCTLEFGGHVTPAQILAAENRMNVSLPDDLKLFYFQTGNGLSLRWKTKKNDGPFANLEFPALEALTNLYHEERGALYSKERAEEYGFPYTDDPELAKQTAARMWHWLPLLSEGNGDTICLDLSQAGNPVLFNAHDWLDGGTGNNGHRLAKNLSEFLLNWGSNCFQFPENLFWQDCFADESGVNWASKEFRHPFKISQNQLEEVFLSK